MTIRQLFLGISVVAIAVACGGADNRDTDRTSLAAREPVSPMTFDTTVALIPTSGAAKTGGAVNGAEVFTKCAVCHQTNGQGMAGAWPQLAGSEWLVNNPQVPIRIVLHGLEGPITVEGKSFNNAMPAWGDQLSDAEIAAVITYERSSWGNNASPITEAQVATERKATQTQKVAWKPSELQGLIHGK